MNQTPVTGDSQESGSRHDVVPVMRPLLPSVDEVSPYLERMSRSRVYSNFGPLAMEFTQRLATHLRVKDARQLVLTANATLALEGACTILDVPEFAVPAFTFPASGHAVVRAGKSLSLLDVSPIDWQIDVSRATKTPRGIIRVLPFGAPVDLTRDGDVDAVIIDAAASLGAQPMDLSQIAENQVVVFSLHATKAFGVGEGGVAVFGSPSKAQSLRTWLNFGFAGTREAQVIATNGKMSDLAAAYGLAVMDAWSEEHADWSTANARARSIAVETATESLVSNYAGVTPYWIAEFSSEFEVSAAAQSLEARNVETRRWWGRGLHRMSAFAPYATARYPVTDDVSARTLGLPMFRDLSVEQFERIYAGLATPNLYR